MSTIRRSVLAALVFLPSFVGLAEATTLPPGFSDVGVTGGLSGATRMVFAPDGRIFVAQQTGALRIISGGTLLSTPFLTLTVNSSGERGLLGIAFDPAFGSNHYIYLYYTATTPTVHNRVSRFTANGNVVVGGSEVVLLDIADVPNPNSATNHNGGALGFSADGKLLITIGERADGSNAQAGTGPSDPPNLLGKMLRMNTNGSIPTDNPFYGTANGINRLIYARGLRNPFSFGVQPGTGRIFISDVGQSAWEEVNDIVAGGNYGWPNTEGAFNQSSFPQFHEPRYAYSHGEGDCITGGTFYNPPSAIFPAAYVGHYFFADLGGNWIREVNPANGVATEFATDTAPTPVDVKTGPDGALYYLTRNEVHRITYNGGAPPFGNFDTPSANATGIEGAIAVTGWALDDVGVGSIELWRDPVSGDPAPAANGKIFLGNATRVTGARPDVQSAFSAYPESDRAGWGYMLLTNLLPNANTAAPSGGVGTFTLYAYVYDLEGNVSTLAPHAFTCNNGLATKPFGTIDTPGQGSTVSGALDQFGWALTPGTATIPTDGSTIQVFIDGDFQGTVQYNLPRNDIQTLFPGYTNSPGPIGHRSIDTTTLTNGVHTIYWIVTDDQNRAEGIGSRYFTVEN